MKLDRLLGILNILLQKGCVKMSNEVIARAEEIIGAKTGGVGGGMEGHCVLALIDENGYPTASTSLLTTRML